MKKLAMAATLTAGVLTLAACSSDEAGSETVVETDAGNITQEEFYEELKSTAGEGVLTELVTVKVLEDNYDVDEARVDEEVQTAKDELGDQFEMALQQQGYAGEEAYRDVVYLSLLQEAALTEGIEVPEEDIEKQYERMQTEIDAQHILVADEETANEVKTELDEGGDFAELAAEYSTDGTAQDGGNLGYFSAGDMVPAFEDAAYNMEVDEISDPVQSEYGYHIIKVNDKRETEEDIGEYEEVKDDIRRDLQLAQVDMTQAQTKVSELIQNSGVDVKIEEFEDLFAPPEQAQPESGGTESGDSQEGSESESSESEEE
ncbi:peptidylprolyl isomerase [Virgibacillus ainsalahensis]